nr:PIN domain-containing protein [Candidatus Sigynarchaeota archaeon]
MEDSTNRQVLFSDAFEFFTPQETFNEIQKYKDFILNKSRMLEKEFDELFQTIVLKVIIVKLEAIAENLSEAEQIMRPIDIKDKWFVAVGLALHLEGFWTEDKHFSRQSSLKVYSTKNLLDVTSRKELETEKKGSLE